MSAVSATPLLKEYKVAVTWCDGTVTVETMHNPGAALKTYTRRLIPLVTRSDSALLAEETSKHVRMVSWIVRIGEETTQHVDSGVFDCDCEETSES